MTKPPAPPPAGTAPARESDRLLRPQPPTPIPPRVQVTEPPGLVAKQLLGAKVHK